MNLANIIQSTQYLEFINSIDNLSFELLYSKNNGYINFSSKEAFKEFESYVSKFKNETEKLAQSVLFKEKEQIIKDKYQEFLAQLKKHYIKQIEIWAEETFSDRIENCLFEASIYKNNPQKRDDIYSSGLSAINWICEIKKQNKETQNVLVENFNLEFSLALKSKDEDFLNKNNPKQSDIKKFLELYNLIADNYEEFLNYNLDLQTEYLNKSDINLLKRKQKNLTDYKKTNTIDEINMVKAALEFLNLKKEDEIYLFIRQLEDDFNLFISNNKTIEEKDKIDIIRKRINLFNEKNRQNYFKKLLTQTAT